MKKWLSAAVCSMMFAGPAAFTLAHAAPAGSKADYDAAVKTASANYKAARAQCDSLKDNAKDVCVKEAKRDEDVAKIVATYQERKPLDKYSHEAAFGEIEENDFNLNVPRYVDTFEPEPEVDMAEVKAEIAGLEEQLAGVRADMAKYMEELGL